MKSFRAPTTAMLIIALVLVVAHGILSLYFLGMKQRWLPALSYFGIGILFYGITIAASLVGALCFGVKYVNTLAVSVVLLCQTAIGSAFVCMAIYRYCLSQEVDKKDETFSEKIVIESGEDIFPSENALSAAKDGFMQLEEKKQTEIEVNPNDSGDIVVVL